MLFLPNWTRSKKKVIPRLANLGRLGSLLQISRKRHSEGSLQLFTRKWIDSKKPSTNEAPSYRPKAEVEKQVEELQKQMPDATQSVDQKVLEELEKQQAQLKELEEKIATRSRRRRSIEGAVESYASIKKTTGQEIAKIQKQLRDADVADATVLKLVPTWDTDVDDLLQNEIDKLDVEIVTLKGVENVPSTPPSLVSVQAEIAKLKELVAKDEVSRKRLLDLQKQIAERIATAERLAKEILNLDEKVTKTLEKQKAKQVALYLDVFKALSVDEAGLKELYSPMQDAIDQLGEEMQFSVSVGYQIDSKSWLDQSARFFDGRRVGAEAKRLEIEKIVETKLVPAWKIGDPDKIKATFEEFLSVDRHPRFRKNSGAKVVPCGTFRLDILGRSHRAVLQDSLLGNGNSKYLSPGTRGIALLVLYLLMDEDDTRPLLIDQPEGNLDKFIRLQAVGAIHQKGEEASADHSHHP